MVGQVARAALEWNNSPGGAEVWAMIELLRTNEVVLLSFVEALLRDAGVDYHVADRHMSVAEGSIGVFPRRVLVTEADFVRARRLIVDAGLGGELTREALPGRGDRR
jgi:hypothetical protein